MIVDAIAIEEIKYEKTLTLPVRMVISSVNLKRRFISSVNRFMSSIKMKKSIVKKSIVADRVQSFLAIKCEKTLTLPVRMVIRKDNEGVQTPTRMDIHKDYEAEQSTTSINLKRLFISSTNRFMSSIKMKKSIVVDRVQSFLAINGGVGGSAPMIINNSSIHDHYEFGGVDLSVASDRKISICFHRATRNAFCCKSVNKTNTVRNDILNEINLMSRVSHHKGIVKLHEVYEDSEMIHLVMELCRGGDLLEAVMHRESYKDDELEAAVIFKQIMESIQYCHERGVVHRDVKLKNIFLAGSCMPPLVKLGDFGLATLIEKGELLYNQPGTLVYVAPEIWDCQGYTESVDIWSAGVLLYGMLSGRFPFDGDNFVQLKRRVLKEDVDLKSGAWEKISEAAKDLISGMLVKSPEFRLNASQVLRHPWLNHEKCQKGPVA